MNIDGIYNPQLRDKKSLLEGFSVRTKQFDEIYNDILTSSMLLPEPHYIIIGQRGSGKTTLVYALKYRIEENSQLNSWLIPIVLGEEQYNITSLGDLWESIINRLEDLPTINIETSPNSYEQTSQTEAQQFEHLSNILRRSDRKIILFIENFGDLIKKFDPIEVKRLREILMTSPQLRLIATSTTVLSETINYHAPFLEFFNTVTLDSLNKEEIIKLMMSYSKQLGKQESMERIVDMHYERLETLRRLTGGVPRTIVLLFRIFIENEEASVVNDLQALLDVVTPLYKHRMDDLPPQQQKIIDAVAKSWDAVSVSELSRRTRLESKSISAQLAHLEKNQVIEKIQTRNKNHLYQIRERFFNIWYLMRFGRTHEKNRVLWLVRFLEAWCDKIDFERRISSLLNKIEQKNIDPNVAFLFSQAYLSCNNLDVKSKERIVSGGKELWTEESEEGKYFKRVQTELDETKTNSKHIAETQGLNMIYDLFFKNELSTIENKIKPYVTSDFHDIASQSKYLLSGVYERLGRYEEAKKLLFELMQLDGKVAGFGHVPEHRLAHIFLKIDRDFPSAEKYFRLAIEKGDTHARNCLAEFYLDDTLEFNKAEVELNAMQIQNPGSAASGFGKLFEKRDNDFSKAEHYFVEAIRLKQKSAVATLAFFYWRREKKEKAIETLESHFSELDQLSKFILARLYRASDRTEEAYSLLMKLDGEELPEVYHQLAHLLRLQGKKSESVAYFEKAIAAGEETANSCFAEFLLEEVQDKERALKLMMQHKSTVAKISDSEVITLATILLWNNRFDESIKEIEPILSNAQKIEKHLGDLAKYFIFMLAKGQTYLALKLFTKTYPELQDFLKPTYYAITYYHRDQSDEYLKMGAELKETVKEIISEIDGKKM